MKAINFIAILLLLFQVLLFAGCGSDTGSTPSASTLAASQQCLGCHLTTEISPVTGMASSVEWQISAHNTESAANKTGSGAGCRDCHGPAHNHPNSCGQCHGGSGAITATFMNPDAARQCENCHGPSHPLDVMIVYAPQHFGNMTASVNNTKFRASYVSSNYVANCRKCHNPHDPSSRLAINKQWAASGHGDTLANARTAYDFKTRGTYLPVNTTFENYCVRCHTTTGYIDYVTSGFTDQRPFAGPGYPVAQYPANSTDKTKEVTACNACHDDGNGNSYSYKLRAVPQVMVYYNYSSATKVAPTVKINNEPFYFPDAGTSNLCIVCHAGRGTGSLIKEAAAKFLNFSSGVSAISAHAFPGASIIFKVSGYEYDGRDYTNSPKFLHDSVGLNNFMNTGSKGPCITCHMKSNESHSFVPVAFSPAISNNNPSSGVISAIVSNTCSACHDGTSVSGTLLSAWTPQTLQTARTGFQAAVACLNAMMNRPNKVVPGTPANWERLYGKGTGPNTMGANFNYNLLKADWGAYAHNDIYAKRLIYDSIDWLYDGNLDTKTNTGGYATDVEAAINSLTKATNPWSSPTYTYTSAELAQLKVNAINYLLGGHGGSRP